MNGVRIGTVLEGKYELVRLLGQGGMGEVYEGRHRVIGRRVAVKFLLGEYARHPEVVARFENEARAAGGTEHENIAGVFDVGSLPDGAKYLVMEFLDGEDVDKLVDGRRLSPPREPHSSSSRRAAPSTSFISAASSTGISSPRTSSWPSGRTRPTSSR